jgi:hypothetical protein
MYRVIGYQLRPEEHYEPAEYETLNAALVAQDALHLRKQGMGCITHIEARYQGAWNRVSNTGRG